MPIAARIALLIVGILLLAAAVIGAMVAAARKNSLRSGRLQRLAIGVVGAALIAWALAQWPRAAQEQTVAPTAAVPTTAAPPAAAAPAAAAAANPSAPGAAPVHPDLIFLADSVFEGCVAPSRPGAAPDGTKATRAQMQASQAAAKAFDAATDSYLSCLNTAANNFTRQYGRGMTQSNLRAVNALHTRINNAAVDVDQSVADQFNKQLQIFKARPGS
ncbi:MAG TPA: hypothetical protein VHX52_09555 [Steroidobacteraceae bacterium]|jgi:uncharacterized membrane protein YeaQ/YmgE (transglycosylase-associated protein family)|nr:hypothetical protein [Steroidobacteraceae bacterium]